MTKPEDQAAAGLVIKLVDQIKPLLAGHEPRVQCAVCVELTSMWIAGHIVAGQDPTYLLQYFDDCVREVTEQLVKEHEEDQPKN